jgi:uridine phosphorylase
MGRRKEKEPQHLRWGEGKRKNLSICDGEKERERTSASAMGRGKEKEPQHLRWGEGKRKNLSICDGERERERTSASAMGRGKSLSAGRGA